MEHTRSKNHRHSTRNTPLTALPIRFSIFTASLVPASFFASSTSFRFGLAFFIFPYSYIHYVSTRCGTYSNARASSHRFHRRVDDDRSTGSEIEMRNRLAHEEVELSPRELGVNESSGDGVGDDVLLSHEFFCSHARPIKARVVSVDNLDPLC